MRPSEGKTEGKAGEKPMTDFVNEIVGQKSNELNFLSKPKILLNVLKRNAVFVFHFIGDVFFYFSIMK